MFIVKRTVIFLFVYLRMSYLFAINTWAIFLFNLNDNLTFLSYLLFLFNICFSNVCSYFFCSWMGSFGWQLLTPLKKKAYLILRLWNFHFYFQISKEISPLLPPLKISIQSFWDPIDWRHLQTVIASKVCVTDW